jgi:hypothetical protein
VEGARTSLNDRILRPVANPFAATGGLVRLTGNLGEGIIKTSAVDPARHLIEAPARVFHDQAAVKAAFRAGELDRDVVVVVRFQGPRANGMPELHGLTPLLTVLQDRGHRVALVTDGRMSGASGKVPAAIHVAPEAAAGGPLARLRDGDVIRLDATAARRCRSISAPTTGAPGANSSPRCAAGPGRRPRAPRSCSDAPARRPPARDGPRRPRRHAPHRARASSGRKYPGVRRRSRRGAEPLPCAAPGLAPASAQGARLKDRADRPARPDRQHRAQRDPALPTAPDRARLDPGPDRAARPLPAVHKAGRRRGPRRRRAGLNPRRPPINPPAARSQLSPSARNRSSQWMV